MEIDVQLTAAGIPERIEPPVMDGLAGAWVEFRGVVRGEEKGAVIGALEYEAYAEMAVREMRRLLEELSHQHACLAARVIHRVGRIPVGEAAIYVGVAGRHRAEAFALLTAFMDRLKQDVPVWKVGSHGAALQGEAKPAAVREAPKRNPALLSLDEARAVVESCCQPLPPVRVPLGQAGGRILRETVCAPEDWPPVDKSTRDGYAILAVDPASEFAVVDSLHAADWKPRELKPGEAVRVATGTSLPCEGLRVVMQEDVERVGDRMRIVQPDDSANVRRRGEEVRAGEVLVGAGAVLNGGTLALLATAGQAEPSVSPRLRVVHYTTGDEIVSPEQAPLPGQIRDSNSFLIRGLLEKAGCEVGHFHLPEDFQAALSAVGSSGLSPREADVLLISGGASVGDKDFTRPLLEALGYQIRVSQVSLRPGKPLLFGKKGRQVAFGLPGNPLSHFVCCHAFVAAAVARLSGREIPPFQMAKLAEPLEGAHCVRETLWPARLARGEDGAVLRPLPWSSSGDVTSLGFANALLRIPAQCASLAAGERVEFLPAE